MKLIKEKIFLAYDIRGKYPTEINADVFWRLGYFFPKILQQQNILSSKKIKIIIGRDNRPNGLTLTKNLFQGLIQNDVEVVDAGIITTPMLYFLIKNYNFDLGFMITASHLKENYNGLKIYTQNLDCLSGKWLANFLNIFNQPAVIGLSKGKIIRKNFINQYSQFLIEISNIKNEKQLKKLQTKNILICCPKNTQSILEKLKKELKLKIHFIHQPIEKRLLIQRKPDLFIRFDNDGDRLYVFYDSGEKILGDIIGAFFIELKNQKNKNGKIILDHRSTELLNKLAKKYHFQPIYSPSGHSIFKKAMRENNALLGIEKSGHYYWKEFFFADSGIYSFLMLLIFLANKKESLNNLVAEFVQKQIILPEINFKIKSQKKMDEIFKEVEKVFYQNKINKEDGLTVFDKNFKFNLKNSQTELNVLRLNIEAKNKDILDNKLAIIKKIINKYK
ncbi:MAG: hypothetical protein GX873_01220 [Parcubacteria group bacterium]|nr:hypothetical protein [Parcubacteria group bacterium]